MWSCVKPQQRFDLERKERTPFGHYNYAMLGATKWKSLVPVRVKLFVYICAIIDIALKCIRFLLCLVLD